MSTGSTTCSSKWDSFTSPAGCLPSLPDPSTTKKKVHRWTSSDGLPTSNPVYEGFVGCEPVSDVAVSAVVHDQEEHHCEKTPCPTTATSCGDYDAAALSYGDNHIPKQDALFDKWDSSPACASEFPFLPEQQQQNLDTSIDAAPITFRSRRSGTWKRDLPPTPICRGGAGDDQKNFAGADIDDPLSSIVSNQSLESYHNACFQDNDNVYGYESAIPDSALKYERRQRRRRQPTLLDRYAHPTGYGNGDDDSDGSPKPPRDDIYDSSLAVGNNDCNGTEETTRFNQTYSELDDSSGASDTYLAPVNYGYEKAEPDTAVKRLGRRRRRRSSNPEGVSSSLASPSSGRHKGGRRNRSLSTSKEAENRSSESSAQRRRTSSGSHSPRRRQPQRSSLKKEGRPRRSSIQFHGEREVSLPNGEKVRRRTSISFDEIVVLQPVAPVADLTKKPEKLWFQAEQFEKGKERAKKVVEAVEAGLVPEGKKKPCLRGLESLMSQHVQQKAALRFDGWDSVLGEQELQMRRRTFDEYAMAQVYRRASMQSGKVAAQRAQQDAKNVESYLAPTRRYCRRLSM